MSASTLTRFSTLKSVLPLPPLASPRLPPVPPPAVPSPDFASPCFKVTKAVALGSSVEHQSLNAFILGLIALPGYYAAAKLIDVVGRKEMQASPLCF